MELDSPIVLLEQVFDQHLWPVSPFSAFVHVCRMPSDNTKWVLAPELSRAHLQE